MLPYPVYISYTAFSVVVHNTFPSKSHRGPGRYSFPGEAWRYLCTSFRKSLAALPLNSQNPTHGPESHLLTTRAILIQHESTFPPMSGLFLALLGLTLFITASADSPTVPSVPAENCAALKTLLLDNTTIIDATHVAAGSNVTTPGSCQSSAFSTVAVCRVQAVVNTTATSAVHFEAWLPDEWFGRFLGLGNGGLDGCIDYLDLDYGSTLHFASVGSDNGHDGQDGRQFLNNPEVINDFAFRAVHVEAVLGKQIVEAYYGTPHRKAYYLGCSTGGRQATQEALLFPEDFDGLVAGSPATDFNNLGGRQVLLGRFIGAPSHTADSFIPATLWPVISQEILRQCDGLDGVMDGIITDPDQCAFRPEALLCSAHASNTSACATAPQVAALRNIYQPIFGTEGQLLYPRYDPGAESGGNFIDMFSGTIFPIAQDWLDFATFNDTAFSFDNFSVADVEAADAINPGGIATFNGNLSSFMNRGGKILSYHGRQDQLIASDNSLRYYNLISSTLALPNLDDFYRLFLIPGMDHCQGGPGAWAFGQAGNPSNLVNTSSHNILLALVDWVENDEAPKEIIGSVPGVGAQAQRAHCRYPQRSIFNGSVFRCEM
ncbi:tannase and feruloyl esterase-domain-containing protein [Gautieria morchelliformis]|nr:tannase and feruloyl esterase-domain-containing protein [Gautieria morchelliformis]